MFVGLGVRHMGLHDVVDSTLREGDGFFAASEKF